MYHKFHLIFGMIMTSFIFVLLRNVNTVKYQTRIYHFKEVTVSKRLNLDIRILLCFYLKKKMQNYTGRSI